jgi:hypothetical protein
MVVTFVLRTKVEKEGVEKEGVEKREGRVEYLYS